MDLIDDPEYKTDKSKWAALLQVQLEDLFLLSLSSKNPYVSSSFSPPPFVH